MTDASEIKILTDEEVDAIEALIRAAIRWTDTGGKGEAKVIPSFGLLMADYRRLRQKDSILRPLPPAPPPPITGKEPWNVGRSPLLWTPTPGQKEEP